MSGELNNRVFVQKTALAEGPELDERYEFLFALYPDDLVEFQKSEKTGPVLGYYRNFDIDNGGLRVSTYKNGLQEVPKISVVRAKHFAKVQVNLLGKVSK